MGNLNAVEAPIPGKEALDFAEALSLLHSAANNDWMLSFFDYLSSSHPPCLHVSAKYFNENFGGFSDVVSKESINGLSVQKSILHKDVQIICIEWTAKEVAA
jgi:hypothetical protein